MSWIQGKEVDVPSWVRKICFSCETSWDVRLRQMDMPDPALLVSRAAQKRLLDIMVAVVGLLLTWWIIMLAALVARLETGESGIFVQSRIGRFGKTFSMYKIRTMKSSVELTS